jgi:hypothetical protein
MVRLLRHRQTKGTETDMPNLTLPRHIPTLPLVRIDEMALSTFTDVPRQKRTFGGDNATPILRRSAGSP